MPQYGFTVNGEFFQVVDSAVQRDASDVAFGVVGNKSAAYYLTESDQTDPAGRYRMQVSGDAWKLQRKSRDDEGGWGTPEDLIVAGVEEISFGKPFDLSQINDFVNAIAGVVEPDVPETVWLGAGSGPTQAPVKCLALTVDGQTLYVPCFR